MLWDIQHFYEDFNLLVLTFQAIIVFISCKWLTSFSNSFLGSFSPQSSINVSISFSIERHHPPHCLVARTTCFTSFSVTRTPLKGGTCFLRSHPHPLTLWVLIALILRDTWELRSWLMRQCIQSSVLASLPGGRAGSPSLVSSHCIFLLSLSLILATCPPETGRKVWVEGQTHLIHGTHGALSLRTKASPCVQLCCLCQAAFSACCWCSIVHTLS